MATIAVCRKIEPAKLVGTLQEAAEKLDSADREIILDFSSVDRVDPAALSALEQLARKAEEKSVKVMFRGVNIDVYKTLKLVKLTSRFSFVS